ncbi:Fe-S protein assembly co-chaperone HscB [Acidithiobacillus sp. AMEEHan]|uniref:Fe-S protein assembly co-chaperone HscB n=1 Tax=Acidithiobacillus sp. AMEEHan TaxID=2994951 RepID=UPI0027E42D0D|nr:Fe-S protein assembly co-chaperone HscB [Acidithiobacillus sp. AMEEHan]
MIRCAVCRAEMESGSAICPQCGALQPFDPSLSLFAVLGLEEGFAIDSAALRSASLERLRALHPDRFARADGRTQRQSLEWTTRINEAQAILGDPLRRGDYLFSRHFGHSALGEEMGSLRDPELLMRQMERREALEDAAAIRDQAALDRLRTAAQAEEKQIEAELAAAFTTPEAGRIAPLLQEWQYLRKFLAEIDQYEEQWDFA